MKLDSTYLRGLEGRRIEVLRSIVVFVTTKHEKRAEEKSRGLTRGRSTGWLERRRLTGPFGERGVFVEARLEIVETSKLVGGSGH